MTTEEFLKAMKGAVGKDEVLNRLVDQFAERAVPAEVVPYRTSPDEFTREQFEERKRELATSGIDGIEEILDMTYEEGLEQMQKALLPTFTIVPLEPTNHNSVLLVGLDNAMRPFYLPEGHLALDHHGVILEAGHRKGVQRSIIYSNEPAHPFWIGYEGVQSLLRTLMREAAVDDRSANDLINSMGSEDASMSLVNRVLILKSVRETYQLINATMENQLFGALDLMRGVYPNDSVFMSKAKSYAIETLLPKYFGKPFSTSEEVLRIVAITECLIIQYLGVSVLQDLYLRAGTSRIPPFLQVG